MTAFSRWSQRKRGIEPTEEQAPESALTPNEQGAVNRGAMQDGSVTDRETTADGETTPPPEAAEALPDPESLPPGSDLTAYLAHGVSREVRRRALKRMFAADHYHHRDGLNDYDEDYRQLKNLSQEVADRLREWARQPADQAEDTQREPEQAERDSNQAAETAEAKRDDKAEADDASLSNRQAQTADSVTSEPTEENGKEEAKPPFPEKGQS